MTTQATRAARARLSPEDEMTYDPEHTIDWLTRDASNMESEIEYLDRALNRICELTNTPYCANELDHQIADVAARARARMPIPL